MRFREISGIGTFRLLNDYWECTESLLDGISVTVLQASIRKESEARLQWIVSRWPILVDECRRYIAQNKADYGLRACSFTCPSIILGRENWTVYFNTEDEVDSVVGVEFLGDMPRQLVVGD